MYAYTALKAHILILLCKKSFCFPQEQFALELVVHDFLTQFCGRTLDPENADFFYLPIIRDVSKNLQYLVYHFRVILQK